jgi:hypothetical protein
VPNDALHNLYTSLIKEKMGRIYSTHGGKKKKILTAFWLGNIEGIDHLRE